MLHEQWNAGTASNAAQLQAHCTVVHACDANEGDGCCVCWVLQPGASTWLLIMLLLCGQLCHICMLLVLMHL
jgi:hypothetical protein